MLLKTDAQSDPVFTGIELLGSSPSRIHSINLTKARQPQSSAVYAFLYCMSIEETTFSLARSLSSQLYLQCVDTRWDPSGKNDPSTTKVASPDSNAFLTPSFDSS